MSEAAPTIPDLGRRSRSRIERATKAAYRDAYNGAGTLRGSVTLLVSSTINAKKPPDGAVASDGKFGKNHNQPGKMRSI